MSASDGSVLRRRVVVALGTISLALWVTSCGGGTDERSGAPPTVVCGTTLWSGASGAAVNSVWQSSPAQISVRHEAFIRVSRDCSTGSVVTIDPPAAATITATAKADDGGLAAVVVSPRSNGAFSVTAAQQGHVVGRLQIKP